MIIEDNLFPHWEINIPTLGKNNSQAGNKMGQRLTLDDITARPQRHSCVPAVASEQSSSVGSSSTTLRLVILLLLLLFVGVNSVKADDHPFVLTTAADVTNGTETLYYIESKGATGFYMIAHSNNTNVSTSNMPNLRMLWYFMDAGTANSKQYYYVVNKSTGRYLFRNGTLGNDNTIQLATYNSSKDNQYKFSIGGSAGEWIFYPEHGGTEDYWVNKKSSNVPYDKYLKSSNYGGSPDDNSKWNFVEKDDVTWAHPFTDSNSSEKHYYLIRSANTNTFYMSTDNGYAAVSTDENNNRIWYLEEAGSDTNFPDFKYYYIVNANTGNYMYYNGLADGSATSTDAVLIQAHSGGEEVRYQFAVVNAVGTGYSAYSIIPKTLITLYDLTGDKVNSLGAGTYNSSTKKYNLTNNDHIATIKDRGVDTNSAHWTFVPTTFDGVWADPEITCDLDGHITITNGEEAAGAVFYYTIDGSTVPTTENTQYDATNKPTVSAGKTTIMVRAIATGKRSSNVITKTIVYYPTITFTEDSYTYTGSAQNPVSSVDYVDANNSANNIHFEATTHYTVSYKKGDDVVSECKNADAYTVVINDVEGDDYIVCGTKPFTINQKTVTITADDATKTYNGTALTKNTFSASALETGDTHEFAVTMTEGSTITNVGSQSNVIATVDGIAVTTGTATSVGNYLVTTADGTLTINPKAITITADDKVKAYGDADPELTATIVGLVEGEAESLISYTISREEGNDVGSSYAITPSGEVAQGNYTVTYVSGTLTVTPKAVTVTADNKTKTYGDEDPELTATIDGLVAGESESLISYTISREEGNTVGSYTITATGEAAQGNYTVTYPTGTLTITKRPVRVISGLTANNKTYDGTTNATLVTTDATFGDGDVLTGDNLTIDSATGTFDTKDVGTGKTVVISGLSLGGTHAGNYELASSGNQTSMTANITPATLSVTANNKTIGYGDAPDNDGVVYGGFVNDEDYDVLGGTLVYSYNSANDGSGTAYTTTSSTGTYYIIPGGLTSGNYTITFVPGTLTVGAKDIGNGTAPADGFSISVGTGSGDSFVVKNGEITLNPGVDYDVNPVSTSASGKYSNIKIQGKGNYQNEFEITKANVDFSTDDTGSEWSATFVAEGADSGSPDSDKGHALPEGISAYIITAIDGNIAVSESLGYMPEGVPVLLLSNADANGFLVKDASGHTPITTEDTGNQKDANMLEEVTDASKHFDVATIYLLYKNEFVLNKAGDLAKGKVYLNPNHGTGGGGGGGFARLKISKGDNTGIKNIEYTIESQYGVWYTLDGRRLSSKPTKKGIYLQGGKKIVVK